MSKKSWLRCWLAHGFLWSVTAITLLGLLVRFTLRDRIPVLDIVFYASPLPLLTVGLLVAGIGWHARRKRLIGYALLAGSAATLVWTLGACNVHRGFEAKTMNLRVLFWNTAHGGLRGIESAADTVDDYRADLVAVVEGDADGPDDDAVWQRKLNGYASTGLQSGMIVLVRGEIQSSELLNLPGRGRVMMVNLSIHDDPLCVAVVDFDPNILHSRRTSMTQLLSHIKELPAPPDLIMGDFNTPGDSVVMDLLRAEYTHAFDAHGEGYTPTWPVPLPVLQLDHIWIGPRVQGMSCEAGWTWQSDHRPVLLKATMLNVNVEGFEP